MNNLVRLFVVLCSVLLVSCSVHMAAKNTKSAFATVGLVDKYHVVRSKNWVLHNTTGIYIQSTSYSTTSLRLSTEPHHIRPSFALNQGVFHAFRSSFPATSIGRAGLTLEQAFVDAANANAQIMLVPEVLEYRNKLNSLREFKGEHVASDPLGYGLDSTLFRLAMYDVRTQTLLDNIHVHSHARWFTPESDLARHYQSAVEQVLRQLEHPVSLGSL